MEGHSALCMVEEGGISERRSNCMEFTENGERRAEKYSETWLNS